MLHVKRRVLTTRAVWYQIRRRHSAGYLGTQTQAFGHSDGAGGCPGHAGHPLHAVQDEGERRKNRADDHRDRTALRDAAAKLAQVQFIGESLQLVTTARNLGVIFDTRLSFEAHVDGVVAKCFGILIGLMHAKHMI